MPKYFSVPIPQLIEIKKTKKNSIHHFLSPWAHWDSNLYHSQPLFFGCLPGLQLRPLVTNRSFTRVEPRDAPKWYIFVVNCETQKGRLPIATVSEGHDPKKSSFFLKVCGPWKLSKNDFSGFPPRQNVKDANLVLPGLPREKASQPTTPNEPNPPSSRNKAKLNPHFWGRVGLGWPITTSLRG